MAAEEGPDLPETPEGDARARRAPRRRRPARVRTGLGARLFVLAIVFGLVVVGFELAGKPIRLPMLVVSEIENRLNATMEEVLPGTTLSVGGIEVVVGADWVPHLRLDNLQLARNDGPVLATLPETELTLDPQALVSGKIRARSVRISGAAVTVRRDIQGRFDFSFGSGQGPKIDGLGALFAALDKTFASPQLARFRQVQADALSVTFHDAISRRSWTLGDGHFVFQNRLHDLAAQLSVSLVGQEGVAAEVDMTAVSEKGRGTARITATVHNVAARDLAAQTPVLGFLAALNAPISGQLVVAIDTRGVEGMEGRLDLGAGKFQPADQARPLSFDRASLSLRYLPEDGRIQLGEISVESRSLRVKAQGQALLVDAAGHVLTGPLDGRRPAAFLGQVRFDKVLIDPEGIFEAPISFSKGAIELKLALDPFTLTLGQFSLAEGDQRLVLKGRMTALADGRLQTALDLNANKMSLERLLALWPPQLVEPTRHWIVENIATGTLSDIHAALREVSGSAPVFELDYAFHDAAFHFLKEMPEVVGADGYSSIQGQVYTMVLDHGTLQAPQGGTLDMAGSVMKIADIFKKPWATGDFHLHASGPLTATLSILDQPPFEFLTKAGRPVTLGTGSCDIVADINVPLSGHAQPDEIAFDARATVTDFRSDQIVAGKQVASPRLSVHVTPGGMTISGPGKVGAVPVSVTYAQGFGPDAAPPVVTGTAEIGPVAIKEFDIGLPPGSVKGQGVGTIRITLPKGASAELELTSNLSGLVLSIPEIGWRKPAATQGKLAATVELTHVPSVPRLSLTAPGLSAQGSVKLNADGGLDTVHLNRARVGTWFDGSADIVGRGPARPVGLNVLSGRFVLGRFPGTGGGGVASRDGGPITAKLDTMQVTSSIALKSFSGTFSMTGGFHGTFTGQVNGKAPVSGTASPSKFGTQVHITADDAGAVARAAGMYGSAHGGALDMTLVPRKTAGIYDGSATIGPTRVRNANALADLLNAVSIVGLLDQLNGPGIAFEETQAKFIVTPRAIEITRGSAIGGSLGLTMAGVYHSDTDAIDMQGVISPLYMINAVGAIVSQSGEGLFGFNFRIHGKAADPKISVNPLSILAPGLLRGILRRPAPTIPGVSK